MKNLRKGNYDTKKRQFISINKERNTYVRLYQKFKRMQKFATKFISPD